MHWHCQVTVACDAQSLRSMYGDLRATATRRPQLGAFVDSMELAGILGEPHATVLRTLADLLAEGIVWRLNHDMDHLPPSQSTT